MLGSTTGAAAVIGPMMARATSASAGSLIRIPRHGSLAMRIRGTSWMRGPLPHQRRQHWQEQQRQQWAGVRRALLSTSTGSSEGATTTITSSSSSSSSPRRRQDEEEQKQKGAKATAGCCGHSHGPSVVGTSKDGGGGRGSSSSLVSREFLSKFTMVASVLCAIDCTLLPALLALLQAVDFVGPEAQQVLGGIDLHELSHKAALWVVMPIGTTTTLSNWILHRDKPLAALSCTGLALILGSNVQGVEWLPAALHESRLYNTLGCGMLIGSSYLAHRNEKGHDHDHTHGHSHDHHHQAREAGGDGKAK